MRFSIILTAAARDDLDAIRDQRSTAAIERKIDGLTLEPDKQGKPLTDDLKKYRAIRAAGQRYRVVYQVGVLEELVTVVVIGIRKAGDRRDVYRLASRRVGE